MIKIFRQNKWFYAPYAIFLIAAGAVLILFTKIDSHWFINQQNCSFADWFFKLFTHLGDGLILALVIPLLLFIKYRHAIVLSVSSVLVIFLVQIFKRFILPDVDRPRLVFENIKELHLVEGVKVHILHSFPSGHSATAFSICLLFALILNNHYLKFLFFLISLLVAYSRVYLSQHFLVDVYFGSLIGVFSTTLIYWWSNYWQNQKLDLSIRSIIKIKKNAV